MRRLELRMRAAIASMASAISFASRSATVTVGEGLSSKFMCPN